MHPQQWERIKETFAQIVEQPAARRGRLLDELCADDHAIRREVESLLAAHDDAEHLIDADAYGIAAALRADPAGYAGRRFGQYRIVREIGRGGMGAVFLAERADGEFQRQVALKIGRRSLADPAAERRFRGERQILATLSHPHIAHLLDGGVSADGEPFFVMEYVAGVRIDEFCAQRQLPTRERLTLFLKVCEAVAYAHDRSIVQLLALSLSGAATGDARGPSGSANLEAQEAYLRGALALATSVRQVSNIFAARDHYEQALRLDPDFAPALAGLATAYTLAGSLTLLAPQEAYPKAERAARRALELDPGSAAAHVALAEIEADYNWNWDAAEANNRRALELAPNLAAAHQSYAELLARFGRFAEAAAHSDLAQELDPTRINYAAVRVLHLYYEHRFTDAISQGERVIAHDPDAYLAHLYLSVANAAQGNYAAGLAAGRRASAITGGAVPDLFVQACNYALLNDRPATAALLQRLRGMERNRYVDPFHFVAIHAYLGEPERAFEYLETSYARRSYWMTTLKVHPVVDSLRGDPRFAEMLKRMKLE